VVDPPEFDARITPAVLDHLDAFQRVRYRPESARRMAKDEFARFAREHDMVSVTRFQDGVVEVVPFVRVRGGYEGLNDEKVVLRAEDLPAQLPGALREAFGSIPSVRRR
jgi:hypothetical protein